MSHNYPYGRPAKDSRSDLDPDSDPLRSSVDYSLYRRPQETSHSAMSSSSSCSPYPPSSRASLVETNPSQRVPDQALSLLSSCGLEPKDLALLAELPEHLLTMETLPGLLVEIKSKRRAQSSSAASRPLGTSHPPPARPHPTPTPNTTSSEWQQICSQPVRYPLDHSYRDPEPKPLPPEQVASWQDRWGNPRQTGSTSYKHSSPSEAAETSYPGDYNYGKQVKDRSVYERPSYSAASEGGGGGKAPISSCSDIDYRRSSAPTPVDYNQPGSQDRNSRMKGLGKMPSRKAALDFHGEAPEMYPYACSLCDITVLSEKAWTAHANGPQHGDGQLSLLQVFPDWDCRLESVSKSDDRPARPKAEEKTAPPSRRPNLSPGKRPENSKSRRTKAAKRTKVICAKFSDQTYDETSLRSLAEQFGKVVKIIFFPSLAFVEMGSHGQAEDLVKYYTGNPVHTEGKRITFYLSSTFSFLQSSRVVSFTPAPVGEEGYLDLMVIAKRFGPVVYSLFLPSMAFVEMANGADAEKLVDYYSSHSLKIEGVSIQVTFSSEYNTLVNVPSARKYEESTATKTKRTPSPKRRARSHGSHSPLSKRRRSSRSRERGDRSRSSRGESRGSEGRSSRSRERGDGSRGEGRGSEGRSSRSRERGDRSRSSRGEGRGSEGRSSRSRERGDRSRSSRGEGRGSEGRSSRSRERGDGSRGESRGSEGRSSRSRERGDSSRGESRGSEGRSSRSRERGDSSRGEGRGSEGRSSRSRERGDGSRGEGRGSEGRSSRSRERGDSSRGESRRRSRSSSRHGEGSSRSLCSPTRDNLSSEKTQGPDKTLPKDSNTDNTAPPTSSKPQTKEKTEGQGGQTQTPATAVEPASTDQKGQTASTNQEVKTISSNQSTTTTSSNQSATTSSNQSATTDQKVQSDAEKTQPAVRDQLVQLEAEGSRQEEDGGSWSMDSDIEGMEVIGEDGESLQDESMEAEAEAVCPEEMQQEAETEAGPSEGAPEEEKRQNRSEKEEEEQREQRPSSSTGTEKEEAPAADLSAPAGSPEPRAERAGEDPEDEDLHPDFPESLDDCITLDELSEEMSEEEDRRDKAKCGRVLYVRDLPLRFYTDAEFVKTLKGYGKVVRYFLLRNRQEGFIEMSSSDEAFKVANELSYKPIEFHGARLDVVLSRKYRRLTTGVGWRVQSDSESDSERKRGPRTRSARRRRRSRSRSRSKSKTSEREVSTRKTSDKTAVKKTTEKEDSDAKEDSTKKTTKEEDSSGNTTDKGDSVAGKNDLTKKTTEKKDLTKKAEEGTDSTDEKKENEAKKNKVIEKSVGSEEVCSITQEKREENAGVSEVTADKPSSDTQTSGDQKGGSMKAPQARASEEEQQACSPEEKMEARPEEEARRSPDPPKTSTESAPPDPPKTSTESSPADPPKTSTESSPADPPKTSTESSPADPPKTSTESFKPNNPVGREFVRPVVGYFCHLCQVIYADEDEAKNQHCSSPSHYQKFMEHKGRDC